MPLGWDRLNERVLRPNEHVVFIKPLAGPDEATSNDFLERVAAICVPIMKQNHINVVSLVEHEPNNEFLGRNFNNGEIIELVLKSHSGRWLSFQFVQMVMMHELAHCKQMNHSKDFWAVRNQFCAELRALWAKGYVGEGLWGRGQPLSGQYSLETSMPQGEVPEHLCGGGFRSRGGKRKRKEKVKQTYAEKKHARITKKFGKAGEGVALGGDLAVRGQLERGKKVGYGVPRVAQSGRGRDLRASAALARFEQAKNEAARANDAPDVEGKDARVKMEDGSETESESETDDEDDPVADLRDAVDLNGKKILDAKGRPMVRVCEDEDAGHDRDAQNEFKELGQMKNAPPNELRSHPKASNHVLHHREQEAKEMKHPPRAAMPGNSIQIPIDDDDVSTASEHEYVQTSQTSSRTSVSTSSKASSEKTLKPVATAVDQDLPTSPAITTAAVVCAVCSLENLPDALICMACSNGLDLERLPQYWYCKSIECRGTVYVNHGDNGVCGLCGNKKQTVRWDD